MRTRRSHIGFGLVVKSYGIYGSAKFLSLAKLPSDLVFRTNAIAVTTGEDRAWEHGGTGENLPLQPGKRERTVFSSSG